MNAVPAGPNPIESQAVSPFVEISRNDWAELAKTTDTPLTQSEIENIRGLGDFLDLAEVAEIYLPLSQLLNLYVTTTQQLHAVSREFLIELQNEHLS